MLASARELSVRPARWALQSYPQGRDAHQQERDTEAARGKDAKMATKRASTQRREPKRATEAPILGSTQASASVRDVLVHPDPAPLHEVAAMKLDDRALAGRYAFVRQEKLSRAQIGIAQRYFLRGDQKNARRFYEQALKTDTADPAVRNVASLAVKVFDGLTRQRSAVIAGLNQGIQKNNFTQWCGREKTLTDVTILDVNAVRERIC